MQCKLCGNVMHERLTSFCAWESTPIVKVENVPALVCTVCGEKVFSQNTVEEVQRLQRDGSGYRRAEARIFDFSVASSPVETSSTSTG